MSKEQPVVITTERGLFFGYTADSTTPHIKLRRARCGILWNTTGGWMELASKGPNSGSKIGARADVLIRDVTAVADCTPEAVKAWEAA